MKNMFRYKNNKNKQNNLKSKKQKQKKLTISNRIRLTVICLLKY